MSSAIIQMKGITKVFPGVKALDSANLNAYKGRIMALVGENGAGKSTLMKILTGVYERTDGEIYLEEKPVSFSNTKESQNAGIAMIHQELNLIPSLSIGENIFLGREPVNRLGKIDWGTLFKNARVYMERIGIDEDPETLVGELSIGKQQMVEIAKALSINAKVIIMDEPTGALTEKETESLFNVIGELRKEGRSIVYISHRLKEIFEICDDVTVLRDGQFIGEYPITELNEDRIIELMVGRTLSEQFPRIDCKAGDTVLEVRNLINPLVNNISFKLKKGEIVGVAGLMGSGRTELARTLYGIYKKSSGEVFIDEKPVDIKSPGQAIRSGLVYVSEDRKSNGVVLGLSVKENISLSVLKKLSSALGWIDMGMEENMAKNAIQSMSIKTSSPRQLVRNLSGGNQQKVSLSKSLMTKPKILILDEPTRGVDVGAKKEIYDIMNQFKKEGMSIIMISSEMPEILGMSDRIIVMHEGRIASILDHKDANQENIMRLAVGKKGVTL